MKASELVITAVTPPIGLPGGEILIQCRGFAPGLPSTSKVLFGETPAVIVSAAPERVIVKVPDDSKALGIALCIDGRRSDLFPFAVGTRLATNLHPVANPVIAADGSIITTVSGSRGEQSAHPLVKVSRGGEVTPFPCEIMNPTGLAIGPDGQLYISSRADGTVLRYVDFEHLEVFAEDLGVPCGIVFDAEGMLYVGDRTGRIYRIDAEGRREEFASLPPSVSAFHLAVDKESNLLVAGPTLSMRDPVYRISRTGQVSTLVEGLARPQGLAAGAGGELWITASHRGRKGIFRYAPRTKELVHYVAGPMLVGLAIDGEDVFLVDGSSVYWIQGATSPGRYS